MYLMFLQNSPERLDDIRGDGGSSLVGIGLPGQGDAVLGHVCDYGFVRRTWQLEGLRGLSRRRVCTLWMVTGGERRKRRQEGREEREEGGGGEIKAEDEGAHLIKLQHPPSASQFS